MRLEYEGFTEGPSGRVQFARDVVYRRSFRSLTPRAGTAVNCRRLDGCFRHKSVKGGFVSTRAVV